MSKSTKSIGSQAARTTLDMFGGAVHELMHAKYYVRYEQDKTEEAYKKRLSTLARFHDDVRPTDDNYINTYLGEVAAFSKIAKYLEEKVNGLSKLGDLSKARWLREKELEANSVPDGDAHLQVDAFDPSVDTEASYRTLAEVEAALDAERKGYKHGWTEGFNAAKEAALAVIAKLGSDGSPEKSQSTQSAERIAQLEGQLAEVLGRENEALNRIEVLKCKHASVQGEFDQLDGRYVELVKEKNAALDDRNRLQAAIKRMVPKLRVHLTEEYIVNELIRGGE